MSHDGDKIQEKNTMIIRSTLTAALLMAAGCATADRVQELEDRLAKVEDQVSKIEAAPAAARGGAAAAEAPAEDSAAEAAANKLFEEVAALVKDNKMEEAKAKIEQMEKEYSETRAWRRARKTAQELAVIGKDAPASLSIEQWFQGEGEVNISADKPTLIVFWEEWCPHCRREVPNMQATYTKFKPQGLQLIGLTKITRKSTIESVTEFIGSQEVSYPMAKEDGSVSSHFNVSGIPAAAVVKDGKIVWRGHPARLTDAMIESWL
ncbi:MAG: thiol-disulfide isomerase/thioredoxin [Myxococcota bacterium]